MTSTHASLASSRVVAGVLCLLCTWVPTPSSHLKSRRVQILGYSTSRPEAMTNYPSPFTNVELPSSSHEIGPPWTADPSFPEDIRRIPLRCQSLANGSTMFPRSDPYSRYYFTGLASNLLFSRRSRSAFRVLSV